MSKFFTRVLVTVLLGSTIYLYVQVVDLQRANVQLAASLTQMRTLQAENARLRVQLASRSVPPGENGSDNWMSTARNDLQGAEQAAARGDFAQAATRSRDATDLVGEAVHRASDRSRTEAASIHQRLVGIQAHARTLFHSFGG